jgi:hypothetical protein
MNDMLVVDLAMDIRGDQDVIAAAEAVGLLKIML